MKCQKIVKQVEKFIEPKTKPKYKYNQLTIL